MRNKDEKLANIKCFTDGLKTQIRGKISEKNNEHIERDVESGKSDVVPTGVVLDDFNAILANDRRTKLWFHGMWIAPELKSLTYSNFIRKVNIGAEMTEELEKVLVEYIGVMTDWQKEGK